MEKAIKEIRERLIEGMVEYLKDPDDPHSLGYNSGSIDKLLEIVDEFLKWYKGASKPSKNEFLERLKETILQLNELNEKCKYSLIETDQREDLCEMFLLIAKDSGLERLGDVTEQWRKW